MACRSAIRHDVKVPDEPEPSALSHGQLVHMVIDLQWQLGEHRAKTNRERELVAIHRDTAERERETVTQVNHQLLKQIKVLREVQQWVIELDAREILADSSPEVNQHLAAPTDLRFKLNKMHSKVVVSHEDPENL